MTTEATIEQATKLPAKAGISEHSSKLLIKTMLV